MSACVPINLDRAHPQMRLLELEDIAALLGRSAETIRKDIRRNPMAVPPRLHIPGTRLLRWRECDVESWLAEHVVGGREA
jgi:predicted DNA-binding transcriptional regulator AlpA